MNDEPRIITLMVTGRVLLDPQAIHTANHTSTKYTVYVNNQD